MNRGLFIGFLISSCAVMGSSCSSSDSPSSPGNTLTAPTIQSPSPGASVDTAQPTLTVGNARGGAGNPTYRFEVATSADFTDTVAAEEGIAQGTGATTSWQVPTALEAGPTYFWRARARALGETGPYSSVADFTVEGGFLRTEPQNDLLVFDPLTNGASVGEVGGGTFNTKGWMATDATSFIRYEVPTLRNGFVEFQVTNLREPNPRSDKRMLMIMWDPTKGDYTTNRFRMHLQKMDTRTVTRWHVRLRWISQGEERNTGWDFFDWERDRVYTWRVEWGAFPELVDSQRIRVLFDEMEVLVRNYDKIYKPDTHWIELGAAPRNESLEEAIYSNVRIGVRRP